MSAAEGGVGQQGGGEATVGGRVLAALGLDGLNDMQGWGFGVKWEGADVGRGGQPLKYFDYV